MSNRRFNRIISVITRRRFLTLTGSAAVVAVGCAINPVTGNRQLMLLSEQGEIDIDLQNAPHQFSADYGASQDTRLNSYLNRLGTEMAHITHRPHMPYSVRAVNANNINAYAFPGGSMAITRGILLELEDEAELAGLLGHELGHVNARHTAQRMTKSILASAVVVGAAIAVSQEDEDYGILTAGLGQVAAGALLARYSRDNEREADSLGIQYMVQAGYHANGFVGLMDMLKSLSSHKPGAIELMFATHPMSDERYQTAVRRARNKYPDNQNNPVYRERYQDETAAVRQLKPAIEAMQHGERAMNAEKLTEAENHLRTALRLAPDDYTGNLLMAKCLIAQNRSGQALPFTQKAMDIYPTEAQAHHISGMAFLAGEQFEPAHQQFARYDELLSGNTNITFYRGYCQEGMQHRKEAARAYNHYLQVVQQGNAAEHAYRRLVEWGYIEKPEEQQETAK